MTWWRRLTHRRKMEDQLEKELRFHLDQHVNELIEQGRNPEEARRLASLDLGGPEQVKEYCRDARGTRWLEDMLQDVRFALRMLRKNPAFAAVALLTLALGTGATTVMFTVVNGVLLKPLPYPEPNRLVAVHGDSETWNTKIRGEQNVAYPDFLDCQRDSRSLEMAGTLYDGGTVSEPGPPEYVDLRRISSGLFSVLRVSLAHGRAFLPQEDLPGGAPAIILGYSFWQRHFGGKPEVLGTSVVLDQQRYTVVGLAPADFKLDEIEPDVFTPIGQDTAAFLRSRSAHPTGIVARLRPGATLANTQAELTLIGRHLSEEYADTNAGRTFVVQPLRPEVGDVRSTLWLLLGAVSVVLLIACVNIASLLLARAVSRERELSMRAALGASRSRLVRQCLTESAVLGLSGGLLGLLLAFAGMRPFIALWPGSLPRAQEVHLDWRVMLFAIAVSLLSGLLFGLAPALRSPAHGLEQVLRAGARTVAGTARRLHSAFVISEIALAVVLLVAAGMLGRTLLRLSSLDPGVNVNNVLVTRMALSPSTLADPARIRPAWQDVLTRASRVPGVQSVAIVDTFPMREGNNLIGYSTSADIPPENQQPMTLATSVTPDYLKVMGIPLRRGRFFDDQDRIGNQLVVVIDDVLAKQAFGAQDPVGQRLWIPVASSPFSTGSASADPVLVVGVVGHVRHWGLASDDQAQVRAQLYYNFAQVPDALLPRWSQLMSVAVRTSVPPLSVVESLRQEVRGVASDQVLYEVRTMDQLASGTLARQRFLLLLFGIFACLALLLACIGIYGVLAYLTTQRVPEIGVRMALGARPADVIWLVLRQSLAMIGGGVAVGIVVSIAAGRILQHSVEGMRPTEPSALAIMIPILVFAALFASFVPARRASRIDPMTALRQD
ncbi:MAG TPA: ABC transporter permease [Candidatus Sulfotelmatobacter sp.]|nr:ABC transporter permease [Candidatus Sulfotelmatobacter sp.]